MLEWEEVPYESESAILLSCSRAIARNQLGLESILAYVGRRYPIAARSLRFTHAYMYSLAQQ